MLDFLCQVFSATPPLPADALVRPMPGRDCIEILRRSAPAVLPSLLMCDFGNLAEEISRLEEAGVAGLHLDVMDGNFVPNITYGMPLVETCRRLSNLPLDVHLMIDRPERYLRAFRDAGADILTIHFEATEQPRAVLEEIRKSGAKAGLALNPGTPVARIATLLDACDLVLVMSVEPGFGGQKFNPIALDKLRQLRQLAGKKLFLEIDGGVNTKTIVQCAEAGAEGFAVGSALFGSDDYGAQVHQLAALAGVH